MDTDPLIIDDKNSKNSSDELAIPSWDDIIDHYESRWRKEKEKFQIELKKNFRMLIERFACGKQEVFTLVCPERREKQYIRAFLELFESGYAPHVGDVERLAGKRARKLSVTLPNNYAD